MAAISPVMAGGLGFWFVIIGRKIESEKKIIVQSLPAGSQVGSQKTEVFLNSRIAAIVLKKNPRKLVITLSWGNRELPHAEAWKKEKIY
jgi:hypothetical protein